MITSRSRYALKIMMDLAQHQDEPLHRRHDLAQRQGIPSDYMDHILASLREAGLIESMRGRNGGLRIGKNPADITVWDIFDAVEMSMTPVACLDSHTECSGAIGCISKGAWESIYGALRMTLSSFRLNDLVAKYPHTDYNSSVMEFVVAQECKAPRKAPGAML